MQIIHSVVRTKWYQYVEKAAAGVCSTHQLCPYNIGLRESCVTIANLLSRSQEVSWRATSSPYLMSPAYVFKQNMLLSSVLRSYFTVKADDDATNESHEWELFGVWKTGATLSLGCAGSGFLLVGYSCINVV